MELTTPSGLVITDRRHSRAAAPRPPRDNPPNDNPVPEPPVSVGPNASEGYGNTHVMYPAGMPAPQAWSGWPVEWATPRWGVTVGLTEIMNRVSTVWYCIDTNSGIVASMPPYRLRGQQLLPSVGWMGNPQPEVYTGWTEAMQQVLVSWWCGEAFLWATSRYADDTVARWVMLNPSWVSVDWRDGRRVFTLGGQDGRPGVELGVEGPGSDVLHIRYSSWPGDARGHGPLEAAALNLYGADALERYAANLAIRGGVPWGILTAPGNLNREQAIDAREAFVSARTSAMGAPAVLSNGMTLNPFTINPRDMALIELQQWNASRLALLLAMPPYLAGLPAGGDSMTYNSVAMDLDFHWRAFLRPKVAKVIEAIGNWALPRGQVLEVNRDEYTRPGFNDRATGYATLFGIQDPVTGERAITIPEIRAAERFQVSAGVEAEATSVAVPA